MEPTVAPVAEPVVEPVAAPATEVAQAQPVAEPVQEPAATQAAPVAASAEPQPVRTNGAAAGQSADALKSMLEGAGLVWVNTDSDKLRAAQEAAAQAVKPARVARERKALPPVDATPMQQVETAKHE